MSALNSTPQVVDVERPWHHQGSLDGLCGIYAIVNALTVMFGDEAFDAKGLFRVLLRSLSYSVVNITCDGMHAAELRRLLRAAHLHLRKADIHFGFKPAYREDPASLSQFWQGLREHHAHAGDGSVLLGIAGQYDHWTVMRRIDDDRLVLADSSALDEITRGQATIGRATKARPIIVQPINTFLLWETENIAPKKPRSLGTRQAQAASAEARSNASRT